MASSIEDNVTSKAILHDDILDFNSIIGDILNTIHNIIDHEDDLVETVIADAMEELVRSVCESSTGENAPLEQLQFVETSDTGTAVVVKDGPPVYVRVACDSVMLVKNSIGQQVRWLEPGTTPLQRAPRCRRR